LPQQIVIEARCIGTEHRVGDVHRVEQGPNELSQFVQFPARTVVGGEYVENTNRLLQHYNGSYVFGAGSVHANLCELLHVVLKPPFQAMCSRKLHLDFFFWAADRIDVLTDLGQTYGEYYCFIMKVDFRSAYAEVLDECVCVAHFVYITEIKTI